MVNVQRLGTKAVHSGERHGRPKIHDTCTTPIITCKSPRAATQAAQPPEHGARRRPPGPARPALHPALPAPSLLPPTHPSTPVPVPSPPSSPAPSAASTFTFADTAELVEYQEKRQHSWEYGRWARGCPGSQKGLCWAPGTPLGAV